MNWISNYVRPKINSLFSRRETPDNLWTKCTECGTMLFHRELADNLNVCTACDHHMAITPRDRFKALFDGGIFTEVKVPEPVVDPLHFRDQKKYPERLRAAQKATGERDAMVVAEGTVGGRPTVMWALARERVPAAELQRLSRLAEETRLPGGPSAAEVIAEARRLYESAEVFDRAAAIVDAERAGALAAAATCRQARLREVFEFLLDLAVPEGAAAQLVA